MKPLLGASLALVLAGTPAMAVAQVTQTYQYDVNGRLTGATTVGSGGTNTAAYAYDDADNRTSRSQTGTTAYAALLGEGAGPEALALALEDGAGGAAWGSAGLGRTGCLGDGLSAYPSTDARSKRVSLDWGAVIVWPDQAPAYAELSLAGEGAQRLFSGGRSLWSKARNEECAS